MPYMDFSSLNGRTFAPRPHVSSGLSVLGHHFNPDQPRLPAGQPGGGQWTREGFGAAESNTGYPESDVEHAPVILVGGTRNFARGGLRLNIEPTDGQWAQIAILQPRWFQAIRRVREWDPKWQPTPSFVDTAEGVVEQLKAETREAEERLEDILDPIVARLQMHADRAVAEIDARGDEAFTPGQRDAIARDPTARSRFRGYNIDLRVRTLVEQDPELFELRGVPNKGVDYFHIRTGKEYEMTTAQQWRGGKATKYPNAQFIDTGRPGSGGSLEGMRFTPMLDLLRRNPLSIE